MPRISATRHSFRLLPVLVALACALGVAPVVVADDGASNVRVVPAPLDLGQCATDQAAPATLWLMNTGDRTVRVTRIESEDDAVTVGIAAPAFVPAHGGLEVPVTVAAPSRAGDARRARVRFSFAGAQPVTAEIRLAAVHPDVHRPSARRDDRVGFGLRLAPAELHLGSAPPGERRHGSAWLVNTGRAPVRITDLKGSCGCMDVPDFEPFPLMPGEAVEFPISMIVLNPSGQLQSKHATFIVQERDIFTLPVTLDAIDPLVARLRRHLDARDRFKTITSRAYLAPDARVRHGTREGPGTLEPLEAAERDAAWDRALHTEARYQDFTVDGRAVTVFVTRTNDLHRLLESDPDPVRVTYRFNDDREIDEILVHGDETEPITGGRWEAFATWARRVRPSEMDALRPEGRLVRDEANAARWRALLLEWRRASGLPSVALEPTR